MSRVQKFLLGSVIGALCFSIVGCSTTPPEVRTVRVEVPVPVPCRVKAVQEPAWASAGLKSADPLELKVRALLAERKQRIGYETLLLAAVSACQ